MFVATYLGQCEIAKYLLQCGAEVNNPNEMGVTPLMTVIQNEDFCRYLLIEKIDVIDLNVRDIKGLTALDYAVNCHAFNTAVLLLENGAVSFAFDFILNVAFHLVKSSRSWSDKKKIDVLNKFSETSYPDAWNRNLKINCLEKAVKILKILSSRFYLITILSITSMTPNVRIIITANSFLYWGENNNMKNVKIP